MTVEAVHVRGPDMHKMTNCMQDIVLEAEGSVAEDPKDCSILHIYV